MSGRSFPFIPPVERRVVVCIELLTRVHHSTDLHILANWKSPVQATNILTLNKFQFFGVMTREYLDHIIPVAASAPDCLTLSLWAGLLASASPA